MQDTFVTQQFVTFAVTVGLGLIIGFGYDVLGVMRHFIRLSRPLQFAIDFLYCLVMTVLVFLALLFNNWGEVRAYVFIGIGMGGVLYFGLLSRFCRRLMIKVIEVFIRMARFVARPFLWMFKKTKALILKISAGASRSKRFFEGKAAAGERTVQKIKGKFHRKKKE